MNSVLQCLSNTKPLLEFCLKGNLDEYLNRSSTSVLKGALMRGNQCVLLLIVSFVLLIRIRKFNSENVDSFQCAFGY